MKRKLVLAPAVVVAAIAHAASAQPPSERPTYWEECEDAPRHALELTLGTGYTQGFGRIGSGPSSDVADVANGGIGFDLGVGYRVDPHFGVAALAQYQQFSVAHAAEGITGARGFLGGIDATYHFGPYDRASPWLRVGTGYRLLWSTSSGPTVLYHGFDFLRLAFGYDVRTSSNLAFGPLIGVDLDVYLWQRTSDAGNSSIADPRLSTYLYAGLQGRFDLGGAREPESAPRLIAPGL